MTRGPDLFMQGRGQLSVIRGQRDESTPARDGGMELGGLVVGEERSDGNGGAAWEAGCVGRALGALELP